MLVGALNCMQAMSKSLRILTELVKYSWPSTICEDISPYLWNGTCAITIATDPTSFQLASRRQPNPWRGRNRLVMTSLPGSHEVLDRQTGAIHQHIGYTLAWETAMHGGRHSRCSVSTSVCLRAGKLVECTSLDVYPYATPQYSIALNRTVLVNNAPSSVNIGLTM